MSETDQGVSERDGVLLLNMGGPWSLDDVKPFLRAVFSDRQVIRFPGGAAFQGIWARLIASARAPKVRARYAQIGGGSPLLEWTRKQAHGLAGLLDGSPVELAMRYSEPRAPEAIAKLVGAGCRKVALLPLYPQECGATTGSSLDDARRAAARCGTRMDVVEVRSYHDDTEYVRAVAERVREGLDTLSAGVREQAVVLFSAHGVPERLHAGGDPYVGQVHRTVELVVEELGDRIGEHRLAFQSRAGPVRWVGPSTPEMVRRLGGEGVSALVLVAISFVSDHIETLHELDIELAELAASVGIAHYARAPSLNDGQLFLEALAGIARRALDDEGGVDA
ncbi:MAG: ferrochelatase [Deltaproteobacteria bacterium]|nr:ferrochelatase [Deltaproteobacteria bacterium]